MQNSITPKSMWIIGLAVLSIALALAAAACGSAAQPSADAPTASTPQVTTAPAPDDGAAPQADESTAQAKTAPRFELTSSTGETVSLDSYIGNKNVVVVFYRGFW